MGHVACMCLRMCIHYFLEGPSDLKLVPWGERTPVGEKMMAGMVEVTKGPSCDIGSDLTAQMEIPRSQYPDSSVTASVWD